MVYAAAFKSSFTLPAKYGWYLAGWAFLCTRFDTPSPGRCCSAADSWGSLLALLCLLSTGPDCLIMARENVCSCQLWAIAINGPHSWPAPHSTPVRLCTAVHPVCPSPQVAISHTEPRPCLHPKYPHRHHRAPLPIPPKPTSCHPAQACVRSPWRSGMPPLWTTSATPTCTPSSGAVHLAMQLTRMSVSRRSRSTATRSTTPAHQQVTQGTMVWHRG